MERTITDADADAIAERVVRLLRSPTGRIDPLAIYTVPAAASLAGMRPFTLRAKLRDGILKGRRKNGGTWRILGAELLKLGS